MAPTLARWDQKLTASVVMAATVATAVVAVPKSKGARPKKAQARVAKEVKKEH
jgi:hypothetical protein